jgi:hypothetical protein
LLSVSLPGATAATAGAPRELALVVENMGRLAIPGRNLLGRVQPFVDRKGLYAVPAAHAVLLGTQPVIGNWTAYHLPLEAAQHAAVPWEAGAPPAPWTGPRFFRGEFTVPLAAAAGAGAAASFLSTAGWGKGSAWINGWPLGRYWEPAAGGGGTQTALYVPGEVLLPGAENEIVLLELDGPQTAGAPLPAPLLLAKRPTRPTVSPHH